MPEYSDLEQNRLDKVEILRAEGIEPYPRQTERTHTSQEAIQAYVDADVAARDPEAEPQVEAILVGRLRSIRQMGKITFAHIEDGAGLVQLFFRANEIGQEQLDHFNRMYDLGDFIQASGTMFRTRTQEVTLLVSEFRMLAMT